jgi:hypothetical protein
VPRMPRSPVRLISAVALPLVVALSACGSSSKPAEPAEKLDIRAEEFGENTQITVPKQIEAGVTELQFTNNGKKRHSAQILRYDHPHTPQEALRAGAAWGERGKPLPKWVHLLGGFGAARPAEVRTGIVKLEAGSYVVLDIEAPGGKPVFGTFGVTGESGDAPLPQTTASIKAAEYSFTASELKPGPNKVLFDNTGKQPHHLVAAPLKKGATVADVRRAVKSDKGPPPIDEKSISEAAIVDGGERQIVELDLKSGKYALICFVPDRGGGPPHALKGMISEAVVR